MQIKKRDFIAGAAATLLMAATIGTASAQMELKILAPAAPGGGWDGTARAMQQVLAATGIGKNVQVNNIPGAGGAIGLAQFVNTAKGDPNQIMVNGFVNAVSGFADSPAVINGASDLLVGVFGDAGKHARAAVAVAGLPRNSTVEVQVIVELKS